MRITVKGKNVDVTDALEQYAEKKVQKLGKYLPNIKEAMVTQSVQRNWHIVEITLEGDGIPLLRGEERSDNMYASIDQVVEKMETQIKRFKGKLIGKAHPDESPKEHAVAMNDRAEAEAEAAESRLPEISRVKNFALKPMPPEEAAMQMELVGHDFYMFRNSDTGIVSVIYKREDGDYGLLEPEE
jgi:putative sigma-54 modulation protein